VEKTYFNHVKWHAWLWSKAVLMTPATRKSWLVVPALFHIGQVGQIGNIVFHQGCKARAFHSSGYQPPVKLVRQVDLVILLLDAARQ
jgi:hypothetical protein